ncbi:MAG TPA: hypothetical protein VGC92_08890, partial [Phenylobacterium sp.]
IVYWTRLGEKLPQDAKQQRQARLENALHGFVADGILFRCSAVGDSETAFRTLDGFVPALLASTAAAQRPALVGTRLANELA